MLLQAAASKEELETVTRTAGETRSKHAAAVSELAASIARRDSLEQEMRAVARREAETRALLQQVSVTATTAAASAALRTRDGGYYYTYFMKYVTCYLSVLNSVCIY